MNEAIQPILSMPQFIVLGFILLASISFLSEYIEYLQSKKAHQAEKNQLNEQHYTHTYYNKKIG